MLSSAFDGKTTSTYERSHRINLQASSSGWTIRVRRITPNASSSTIADTTNIESIAEIVDAKLRYPNTALVGIQVDAQQFKSIPTRSFDMVVMYFAITDAGAQQAFGFLMGLFGLPLAKEVFKEISDADLIGALKRRLFGGLEK